MERLARWSSSKRTEKRAPLALIHFPNSCIGNVHENRSQRTLAALMIGIGAVRGDAQKPPAKRLPSIVGVAVEAYGKAVDDKGRLLSAVELDET